MVRDTDSDNEILIWTYTCPDQDVISNDLKWPWVT